MRLQFLRSLVRSSYVAKLNYFEAYFYLFLFHFIKLLFFVFSLVFMKRSFASMAISAAQLVGLVLSIIQEPVAQMRGCETPILEVRGSNPK